MKETSFDSNDTRALSALGGYATIAINNANIYSEIERERETLSAIVDKRIDPILVFDENNTLILVNASGRKVFGLPDLHCGTTYHRFDSKCGALDFLTQEETEQSK
ncbi:MAG: hypothetical protein H6667_24345 [Ardenticatenaceae bacterium]|nr:hypothetical protein [Ardenticatenaceae bacterium]